MVADPVTLADSFALPDTAFDFRPAHFPCTDLVDGRINESAGQTNGKANAK
jgi:hypothetical protein